MQRNNLLIWGLQFQYLTLGRPTFVDLKQSCLTFGKKNCHSFQSLKSLWLLVTTYKVMACFSSGYSGWVGGWETWNLCVCLQQPSFLPPANEVCEGYVFTGVCLSTGGGHAWLLRGGACMVAPGGHAWLLLGDAWLLWGVCVVAPRGAFVVTPTGVCVVALGGGACVVAPGGTCMVAQGDMCGCSGGCAWLLLGGHAWLLLGGHAWLLLGGMCGCSWGVCVVAPVGGMLGIQWDMEIQSMSGWYPSYWNAFMLWLIFMGSLRGGGKRGHGHLPPPICNCA